MPRLEQKPKKKSRALIVALLAAFAVSLPGAFYLALKPQSAAAASIIPNPADMSSGNDAYLLVAHSGDGNAIDAPITYVKIYSTQPKFTIALLDADFCVGQPDAKDPGNANTTYEWTPADANEGPTGYSMVYVSQEYTTSRTACTTPKKFTLTATTRSSLPGHTDLYVGIMRIWNRGTTCAVNDLTPGCGGINAFKISGDPKITGDPTVIDIGYWDKGVDPYTPYKSVGGPPKSQYAVQDRVGSSTSVSSFDFRFSPKCNDLAAPKTAYLRWKDDDNLTQTNNGLPVKWEVRDYGITGSSYTVIKSYDGSTKGVSQDNEYIEDTFTATRYHRYVWHWTNIAKSNGIQMWLPFDSYNFEQDCSFKYQASIDGPDTTTIRDLSDPAMRTIDFKGFATNTGPGGASPWTLEAYATTPAGACGAVTMTSPGGGTDACTGGRLGLMYTGASPIPPGPIRQPGNGAGQAFRVEFKPTAPEGTYCFRVRVRPESVTPGSFDDSLQLCYLVGRPRFGSLQGYMADVHAGGGIGNGCTLLAPDGRITGRAQNNSFGQMGVSGGSKDTPGTTLAFGSNGTKTGTSMTFNQDLSGYGPVCRTDLDEVLSNMAYTSTGGGGTVNLSALTPGVRHVIKRSSDATIIGTLPADTSATIYVRGKATIGSNLIQSDAESPLGIVAQGDIDIPSSVTKIYGYLWTRTRINTCSAGACDNVLEVHGLLSANSYRFNRKGFAGSFGAVEGEKVTYRGEFLYNPPPGFSGVRKADAFRPGYIGEQAPRY